MNDESITYYLAAIAIGFSASIAALVGFATRNITFFGKSTDNHHHVSVAAGLNLLDWPSKMHVGSPGSAAMKVFPVYLLAIFQRVSGNVDGEYPLTLLCIVSNLVSSILVFVIAYGYWGPEVAFLLTVLFASSFWPWLLALHGGPICVSQVCMLFSVLFFQWSNSFNATWVTMVAYLLGGFALGLSQFSSGSARKYIPLSIAAFLYSFWSTRTPLSVFPDDILNTSAFYVAPVLVAFLTVGIVAMRFMYRPMIRALYEGTAPHRVRHLFGEISQSAHRLDHYFSKAEALSKKLSRFLALAILYVVITAFCFRSTPFYLAHLAMITGLTLSIFWLTYPRVGQNLRLFFVFASIDKWNPRFPAYTKFFENIGQPIKVDMRGAGLEWIVAYLLRISPFHLLIFVASNFAILFSIFVGETEVRFVEVAIVFLVSCSPLIVAEVTRAPQMGRSYFPAYSGLLLSIGFALWALNQMPLGGMRSQYGLFLFCFVLVTIMWNAWIFYSDVLPARMAPAWLGSFLIENDVAEISTYDTPFNNGLIGALPSSIIKKVNVRYVSSLTEVNSGLIVVPGTSARAFNMESERWAIDHGDFDLDPALNHLIESRLIEKCAIATFKTYGTSRMWGHESEVVSYMDLILGLIGKKDRYRGHAWILDADRVREVMLTKSVAPSG